MNTILRKLTRTSLGLLMIAAVIGAALGTSQGVQAAPVGVAAESAAPVHVAATLPADTCVLAGSTRTCEMWATTGTLTLVDGTIVPIWGYTDVNGGPAQLPGPTLIANEGETVEIVLHNTLTFTTSLSVPGQDFVPDLIGVGAGGVITYSFTASNVGTYAYEAGFAATGGGPDGTRQVMMGMYGAFVVRPAGQPTWAYGDAGSAFVDEALLVFSEIDLAFNASPVTFTLNLYQPDYWLINGLAYTETASIPTAPGNTVLLRYLNAGIQERTIGLLGVRQLVLGEDSSGLAPITRFSVVAETMGAGQSLDTLVQIPMTVTVGTKYPIYNTGFQQLHNNGQMAISGAVAFGGIVTFLDVVGGGALPDVGPLASGVLVSPNPASGMGPVSLSATLDESTTGGSNVIAAEFFTDTLGADGTGIPMTIVGSGPTVAVTATVSAGTLATWPHGDVTFYVHGQDANGLWGAFSSDVLDLVKVGPEVRGMVLTPPATNGTVDVAIQATADDTNFGNINVVMAEYFLDFIGPDGSGNAMNLNLVAPITSLTAVIPAATVNALPEGDHAIYIHAQDAIGNWGEYAIIVLRVDKTGPIATGHLVGPTPNNGTLSINSSIFAVRLQASFSDMGAASSSIENAEGFIDTAGANGSGFPFFASDAVFNGTSEQAYVDIPLSTVRILTQGPHTIMFHGKDAAGNWGAFASMTIVIDKTGPNTVSVFTTPATPPPGTTFVTLYGNINDPANGAAPASNLVTAEWFRGVDPGAGFGNVMTALDGAFNSPTEVARATINIGAWTNGPHIISVRGKDQAGNWGLVQTMTLTVSGNAMGFLLNDGFEMGTLEGWANAVGGVSVIPEAVMDGGQFGMKAQINGAAPAYVVDQSPGGAASYHASFYFNPNGFDTLADSVDIFTGVAAGSNAIFGVQFERSAGGPEIRGWVLDNGVQTFTAWHHVNDAAQNIELVWLGQNDATFSLAVDGVVLETLTGLNTSAYLLSEVWLGPSAGLTSGMTGNLYFDGFSSRLEIVNYNQIFLPVISR